MCVVNLHVLVIVSNEHDNTTAVQLLSQLLTLFTEVYVENNIPGTHLKI